MSNLILVLSILFFSLTSFSAEKNSKFDRFYSGLGSLSNPAFAFDTDKNTGVYSSGADTLKLVTGGILGLTVDSSQNVIVPNSYFSGLGTLSSPAYSFTGDTNTGLYSAGADTLNLVTGGVLGLTVDSTQNVNILAQKELRLQDTTGGQYIGFKAPSAVTSSTTFILPDGDGTSGQALVTNGSGVLSWASGGAGSSTSPTVQIFTSGSGTYIPTVGTQWIRVLMVGGGAGGAGSGTSDGTAATNGGSTTFGTRTAGGGTYGVRLSGGIGGINSGSGYTVISSMAGGQGATAGKNPSTANGTQHPGGAGGASYFGGGGAGGAPGGGGYVPNSYGAGGGGGGTDNANGAQAGGGGGSGGFYALLDTAPTTTSYSIGAAGSAGGAGTSGRAGAAGLAGVIIVEEHY